MLSLRSVAMFALICTSAFAQTVPDAHFHHLHLNATDPKADIEFYTTKFDAEKASFKGLIDGIWAQKSWILAQKVATAPPSEVVSTIWHFGWGAEDMKATYQKQLDSGTKFATPITDISDIGGGAPNTGRFFYAYVLGPDGALIELNTSNNHHFGHLHLLSADPVATGEWYAKHFAVKPRANPQVHMYKNVQIGPSSSFMMDNVNIIIYPMEYAISSHMPGWENRKTFEPTKGRVVDHIGISVPNLDEAIARLRKESVTITDEPKSIAAGKIKFAFIEGPDKMRIEIIEGHATRD
jgi:catechol 2,3-dioxygenase-like lactoylglutathione lyase family enzyme